MHRYVRRCQLLADLREVQGAQMQLRRRRLCAPCRRGQIEVRRGPHLDIL